MIYINDKIRISKIDDYCLQIEVLKKVVSKKTKEENLKWQWAGYYGNLKGALVGVFKKQLYDTVDEELTLKELISKIDTIEENIKSVGQKIIDIGITNENL